MKRVLHFRLIDWLLLGTFVVFGLVSCENDDEGFVPELILASESIDVPNGSSEQTIDVLSNANWSVATDANWITFEKTEGDKGRFDFKFMVADNEDDERTGVITFTIDGNDDQEFVVTQEAGNTDDIYVLPDGTGEGYSWNEATNIYNALQIATSGNTIHIVEGTYKASTTITGGDSSDERDQTFEIKKNITIKGGYPANAEKGATADPSKYETILSGDDSSYHVVTVSASKSDGQEVVLEGLTISHGNASSKGTSAEINGLKFRRDYGGGVSIGNAVVTIRNVNIIDNKSEKFVAGLYAFEDSRVTIEGSKVNNNISKSNAGGLWIRESKAFIENSEFIANEGGTAAGVHGYPDAEIYMNNSIIAENKGRSYGAAFYVRSHSKGVLVNCLISGNTSTSKNGGGGIMMYDNNEVTLISTTITNNEIAGPGGGIYGRKGVNTTKIYNSIISGNKQKNDGPDVDFYESDAPAPVIQSSVTGDKTYDINNGEITGATFKPSAMLDKVEDYIIRPIGADNPALEYGMTTEELMQLGADQNPAVEKDIITYDLLHESRDGLKTMGAFLKE